MLYHTDFSCRWDYGKWEFSKIYIYIEQQKKLLQDEFELTWYVPQCDYYPYVHMLKWYIMQSWYLVSYSSEK